MNKDLGQIIREARLKQKLSQRELAGIIKVSKSYINKIEHNQTKKPGFDVLWRLSVVLKLDEDKLIQLAGYEIEELIIWQELNNNIMAHKIYNMDPNISKTYKDKDGNIKIQKVMDDYKKGNLGQVDTINLFVEWMKIEDVDTELFMNYILNNNNNNNKL